MALTEWKEEQLRKMPIVESQIRKSKDGKTLIHRTIITDLKPIEYYKVVMENEAEEEFED